MNRLLAIDTSTSRASVALAVGENVYDAEQGNIREHAQYLLPMVQQLLTEADVTMASLDGIVMGQGPGSFTGLRIACSVAKGLAYAHSLPVYPVSSLAAIAEAVFYGRVNKEANGDVSTRVSQEPAVLSLIDARMHEVYWDCYQANGEHLENRVGPISTLVLPDSSPLIIAGVGFEEYMSALPEAIQRQCIRQQVVYPDARAMIRLVRSGQVNPVSAGEALPVYVRNQVVQGASGG